MSTPKSEVSASESAAAVMGDTPKKETTEVAQQAELGQGVRSLKAEGLIDDKGAKAIKEQYDGIKKAEIAGAAQAGAGLGANAPSPAKKEAAEEQKESPKPKPDANAKKKEEAPKKKDGSEAWSSDGFVWAIQHICAEVSKMKKEGKGPLDVLKGIFNIAKSLKESSSLDDFKKSFGEARSQAQNNAQPQAPTAEDSQSLREKQDSDLNQGQEKAATNEHQEEKREGVEANEEQDESAQAEQQESSSPSPGR